MSTLDEADKLVDGCRGWREWAEWGQGLLPDRLTQALTALRDAVHDLHCRIEAMEQNRVRDRTAMLSRMDRMELDRVEDRDKLVKECERIAERLERELVARPMVAAPPASRGDVYQTNGVPLSEEP